MIPTKSHRQISRQSVELFNVCLYEIVGKKNIMGRIGDSFLPTIFDVRYPIKTRLERELNLIRKHGIL